MVVAQPAGMHQNDMRITLDTGALDIGDTNPSGDMTILAAP